MFTCTLLPYYFAKVRSAKQRTPRRDGSWQFAAWNHRRFAQLYHGFEATDLRGIESLASKINKPEKLSETLYKGRVELRSVS